MSCLVDLIRSHLLLRKVKKFQKRKEESVHNSVHDQSKWAISDSLCSWLWAHCKCCQGLFARFLIKSFIGFIGGAFLVFMLLLILVLQLQMNPLKAVCLCALLAPPFSLGLAFSSRVRFATLLVLPQLSSKRGRQTIVAFAYILTITGPVANTVYNMEETAQSLTCGLHVASKGLGKLADIAKRPIETAKKAVEKALNAIRGSIQKIKETLSGLQRVITVVGEVLKSSAEWLDHVVNVCNNEFGTPIERCYHMFEKTSKDCSDTLGPVFSWMCSVVYAGSPVCNTLSAGSLVCLAANPFASAISSSIAQMREKFLDKMNAMFFVEVDYEQDFNADFAPNNRTLSSMLKEMRAELKETTQPILTIYHLIGGILGLTWIIVFYKAHRYHHKFRTNDRFDNYYITEDVRNIDLARIKQGKETLLPLRPSEKRLYCSPGHFRLLRSEIKRLIRSLIFLFLATINIAYSVWCDYSLYWILDLIRRDTVLPKSLPNEPMVKLQVDGQGLIPDMFRNLSAALSSPLHEEQEFYDDLDPSSCLPNPLQPDFNLYVRIASLLILAWVCAFAEPFILRLRPAILNIYYPERARARALWLSAHILRERGGFFRDMARLTGSNMHAEPLSQKDLIEKLKDRSWFARLIFGSKVQACCSVCASAEEHLIECQTFGCNAVYCRPCFESRANLCVICEETLFQPDIPGLELERDSEEEPDEVVVEKEEKQITSMTNKETLSNQLDIVPLISVAEEETTNNAHKQDVGGGKDTTAAIAEDLSFVTRVVNEVNSSLDEACKLLGMELPNLK